MYLTKSSTEEGSSFKKTREAEICDLIKNRTFRAENISNIGRNYPILGSKFVDTIKPFDDGYQHKTWLVAQYYGNKQADNIATKSSTVQSFTQRFILSLAPFMDETSPHVRDVTEAYIQSETPLEGGYTSGHRNRWTYPQT